MKGSVRTGVLLGRHDGAEHGGKLPQPVLLIALRLTGEQEAALRRHYGDAVLPGAVTVGGGGQAGRGAVTMVLVAKEHLALREGVLRVRRLKVRFRDCLSVLRLQFFHDSAFWVTSLVSVTQNAPFKKSY